MNDLLPLLLIVGLGVLLLAAALAPFESLAWWSGWGSSRPARAAAAQESDGHEPDQAPPALIVVYLSGIGSISGEDILAEEIPFLDGLETHLSNGVLIRDVFPYSVANIGLTGSSRFADELWRLLGRLRLRGDPILSSIINARNAFQVAVSADPRYGPIFNFGTAQTIAREARKHGFQRDSGQRIILVGYSGGGQVAVGAAPFVHALTQADVEVISVGGVISSDPGLRSVSRLTHFVGERDLIEKLGYLFAGRGPIARLSNWNRALRAGRIRIVRLPSVAHNIPGGYLDPVQTTPSGETYLEQTIRLVSTAIKGDL
jgi:hypothetical protein